MARKLLSPQVVREEHAQRRSLSSRIHPIFIANSSPNVLLGSDGRSTMARRRPQLANVLPLKMSEQIQGNVLSAFNKDHMSFLLVNFKEPEQ